MSELTEIFSEDITAQEYHEWAVYWKNKWERQTENLSTTQEQKDEYKTTARNLRNTVDSINKCFTNLQSNIKRLVLKNKIKEIDWFNDVIIEYNKIIAESGIDFWYKLDTLNIDNMYSAKLMITVDGTAQIIKDNPKELTYQIREALRNNNTNHIDNVGNIFLSIDGVEVNAVYSTESITTSDEG